MVVVYFDEPDDAGFYTREGRRVPVPELVDAFGGVNGRDGQYYVQDPSGDWVEGSRPTADMAVAAAAKAVGAWVGPKGPPRLPRSGRLYTPRQQAFRFARLGMFMDYHACALPPLAVRCWVTLWREHRPHPEYDDGVSIVSTGSLVERTGGDRRNVRRMLGLLDCNDYTRLLVPGKSGCVAIRCARLPLWWGALIEWQ